MVGDSGSLGAEVQWVMMMWEVSETILSGSVWDGWVEGVEWGCM